MKTNGILSKIEGLQKITEELQCNPLISFSESTISRQNSELKKLKEKLSEEKFYLVVIGLFKRGKSSLVNALVGKEVVPYSVVPLTSVVTLLEYGETDHAKIFYNDNLISECDIQEIYQYVTETENPLNKKNVDYVSVFLNSDFLKKITLVDTPGIGSTFENNTETTYGFVERIDAALFILSADLPISKAEVEFLTKLKSTVPKIIFVLNKTDLISPKETERIISFNKSVLNKIFNEKEINIFPISAKLAVDGMLNNKEALLQKSGIYQLQQEIEDMLETDKHEVIMASARNQLDSMLNKTETMLNIQLKALLTPIDKLNEDYKNFLSSIEIMKRDKGDFEILINGKVKQLQEYVTESLYNFAEKLLKKFYKDIDENKKLLFEKFVNGGIEFVHGEYIKEIEDTYASIKIKLENEIVERFHKILTEYSKGSNRFLNELANNFAEHSLFDFSDLLKTFDLNILTSFYFRFDKNYNPFYLRKTILVKVASILIPKIITNNVKEDLERNIDMNTGRINYDINYKIQESFRKFNSLLNEKLDETLTMLNNIISDTINQKGKTEELISGQIKFISDGLEKLSSFRSNN